MRLHGKFELRFGIELGVWRDSGITPLWCVLTGSASFSTLGNWLRIKQRFDGVHPPGDAARTPPPRRRCTTFSRTWRAGFRRGSTKRR